MTINMIPDEETLEVAAWVCYVHSLDGQTDHKVTDTPKWSSDFHREKFIRRTTEIFEVVTRNRKPVEDAEEPERLITSADVNRACAAKANEMWGGGTSLELALDKSEEELSPNLEELVYLLTNERSVEAAAKAGCGFRLFAQWDTMSSGEQQMYKGKTAYMLRTVVPYLRGWEITEEAVEVAAKTKADLFTGEGSWKSYHPVSKVQYRKEVEASLKAAIEVSK